MSALVNVRIAVLVISILLSFAVLGISAHMLSTINVSFRNDPADVSSIDESFATVPLAAAILSIVYLGSLFIVGIATNASMYASITAESIAIGVLWVFWLAAAGRTAAINPFSQLGGCDILTQLNPELGSICVEYNATEAVSFIIWIVLLGYWITIVTYGGISQNKGRSVWSKSIKEATSTENTKTEHVLMA